MNEPRDINSTSSLRQAVTDATERMQGIIDAAERAAEEIRADAEAEAESYLEARRREADRVVDERSREVAQVAESLVGSVHALRAHVDSLSAELTRAAEQLGELSRASSEPPPDESPSPSVPASRPAPSPVRPAPPLEAAPTSDVSSEESGAVSRIATATATERGAEPRKVPEEALLRATQMAIAGSRRAEIERVLEAEFDVTESSAVVDEILGADAT